MVTVAERVRWHVNNVHELRYGTDTNGGLLASSMGITDPDCVDYVPTPWDILPRSLSTRQVRPTDAFLDLGCGKGRVLCQAAMRYRFARVIGVEHSAALARLARQNMMTCSSRMRTPDWQVHDVDVREFEIPSDVAVVFLFNPFVGDILGDTARRLRESVDRHPRPLHVIYYNPTELSRFEEHGFVCHTKTHRKYRDPTALLIPS